MDGEEKYQEEKYNEEKAKFIRNALCHPEDNRYCHKGPIYCLWEFLYIPDRPFVRVPDYLTHFDGGLGGGNFPLWTIDQGYVGRVYESWYFWKFIRDLWWQEDGRRWCLCPNAPYALISLLTPGGASGRLANGYTETDIDAITIW